MTSGLRSASGTRAARAVLVMAAVHALFVSCVARAADQACRAPTSPSAIPEVLEFTEGHGYFGSDRVYLERGRLIMENVRSKLDGSGAVEKRRRESQPSTADWATFWTTVDRLGVWCWQAQYSSSTSGQMDGAAWRFRLSLGTRDVSAAGYNATPGSYVEFRALLFHLLDTPSAAASRRVTVP